MWTAGATYNTPHTHISSEYRQSGQLEPVRNDEVVTLVHLKNVDIWSLLQKHSIHTLFLTTDNVDSWSHLQNTSHTHQFRV